MRRNFQFSAFGGRWLGAGRSRFRTRTGYEVAQIVTEQHNDPMRLRDVLPASQFLFRPVVALIGQKNVIGVSFDAGFNHVVYR